MHNISFDESQHKVVQSRKVPTLDVHVSPVQIGERVFVFNVCRHLPALAEDTKAYTEATNSSVRFLIAENERMAKELQATKQGKE